MLFSLCGRWHALCARHTQVDAGVQQRMTAAALSFPLHVSFPYSCPYAQCAMRYSTGHHFKSAVFRQLLHAPIALAKLYTAGFQHSNAITKSPGDGSLSLWLLEAWTCGTKCVYAMLRPGILIYAAKRTPPIDPLSAAGPCQPASRDLCFASL